MSSTRFEPEGSSSRKRSTYRYGAVYFVLSSANILYLDILQKAFYCNISIQNTL
jgi:hypothetical protein